MSTTSQEIGSSLGGLVVLLILALIVWLILPASWTDPFLYSVEYGVNTDQVQWNPKPTDCDFMHAPLGDKDCHYKKAVTAYNAAGFIVAGDGAPQYGHDASTGKPIISYDEGKTWTWLPEDAPPTPDLTVKRVGIGWIRVND